MTFADATPDSNVIALFLEELIDNADPKIFTKFTDAQKAVIIKGLPKMDRGVWRDAIGEDLLKEIENTP